MIVIHWLMLLVLSAVFTMGVVMVRSDLSPATIALINYHKWLGITALVLVILRLAVRMIYRKSIPPPLPASKIQEVVAHSVHSMLYVCMFSIPVIGWFASSAAGYPVVVFGLIPLPNLLEENEVLAEFLNEAHVFVAYLGLLILFLHVAGAMKHVIIDKDDAMKRMTRFTDWK